MTQAIKIPLFHVPGITNASGPKPVSLIHTPDSKKAWFASESSRLRLPDLQPRLLLYHEPKTLTPVVKEVHQTKYPTINTLKPSLKETYKTKYPILNSPKSSHQAPPQFIPTFASASSKKQNVVSPKQAFSGFPISNRQPMLLSVAEPDTGRPYTSYNNQRGYSAFPIQKGPSMRLINPREVLEYENQKRARCSQGFFQSVRYKNVQSTAVPIPPLPIMKVSAPRFAESERAVTPPVQERVSRPAEEIRPKTPPQKKVSFAETTLKDSGTSPRQSDFEGALSQSDIKHEFEKAAAMHYLASVGKQQAVTKPRTKETGQQTEISGPPEIEEPSLDKVPPKMNHLPPDIYLKLRFAKDSGLPLESVAEELNETERFVKVAEVDTKTLLTGIARQKEKDERERSPVSITPRQQSPRSPSRSQAAPILGYRGPSDKEWKSANSIIADHMKKTTQTSAVKQSTKNNWSSAMKQMSSQLDAIDEMAQNMQNDFKSTERLVETIDTLTDAMSPKAKRSEETYQSRKAELKKRSLSPLSEVSNEQTQRSPKRAEPPLDAYTRAVPYHHPQYVREEFVPPPLPPPVAPYAGPIVKHSREFDEYRNRMNVALRLANDMAVGSSGAEDTDSGWRQSEEAQSSLHSSLSLEQDLSIISHQRRLSPTSSKHSFQDPMQSIQDELNDLSQILEQPEAKIKHWKDRTDAEKASLRRWMAKKRKERTQKYREEVQRCREREKRPFQPPKDSKMNSTFTKQNASLRRQADIDVRLEEAMNLLKDLKSDHPYLPTQDVNAKSGTQMRKKSSSPVKGYQVNSYSRKKPYQPLTPSRRHMTTASGKYNVAQRQSTHTPRNQKLVHGQRKQMSVASSDHLSDISGLSGWSMPDEVKALLYSTDSARKPSKGVTFDLGKKSRLDKSMDDFLPDNSVNLADLGIRLDDTMMDDHASQNTESLLAEVDWADVERLVASVGSNVT